MCQDYSMIYGAKTELKEITYKYIKSGTEKK